MSESKCHDCGRWLACPHCGRCECETDNFKAQLAEARELLEKADGLLDQIDTLDYLALWADKEWHQGRDELITTIAKLRARSE